MISTLVCAFKSTASIEQARQHLYIWSPTNPLGTITEYFYNESSSQFETSVLDTPNPDPEHCITVLVGYSKCQGLMYAPLNELDAGVMVFYTVFPVTTEQGLDGNEVLLIICDTNDNSIVFTWKDVINKTHKQLDDIPLVMYIQRSLMVNLTMDLNFKPLAHRFSCKEEDAWAVRIAAAPTIQLPRYVNWLFIPSLFTQEYVEDRIRQTLFVFGNLPFYKINMLDFMNAMCNIYCAFIDQSGNLTRHISDFNVNVNTKLEGVCMGYHLYMHVLFSFSQSKLIQQVKRCIVLSGFPVPLFGEDEHGESKVVISLIPAFMLVQLLYPNKHPDNWMHQVEMQMGFLSPLLLSSSINIVDQIDPACVFNYAVTDLPALLFNDTGAPVMMQLYHKHQPRLLASDVINDTLTFAPMELPYRELYHFQRYHCKPIRPLQCHQSYTWPTHACSIRSLHLSKRLLMPEEIARMNKDSSWRYDQVRYGTGVAIRFYTSQFWFF